MVGESFQKFNYDRTIPFAFYKQIPRKGTQNLIAHHHKEIELIAMIDGEATFYIDYDRYVLRGGDVLVVPPYCIHRATVAPKTSYDCICFDLSLLWDEELRNALEESALTVSSALSSALPSASLVKKYIKDAITACEGNAPGWEMEVIGALSLLFATLKKTDFFVKASSTAPKCSFEKTVFQYVTEHFAEPITSDTVAKEMYLNNSYFCRAFKKSFGCCFGEYLTECRMEKAKFYLLNSKESVSEIALKTGYHSFSYFCKEFKRLVGTTPSSFRKTYYNGAE